MAAPKILLRLSAATSSLLDMSSGTTFQPVLPDPAADPSKVTKVVFLCGKHYYTLVKERETRGANNVAIIRLEVRYQYYSNNNGHFTPLIR